MLCKTRLVIFDLDDTLIYSNINYSQIRYKVADLFPIPLSNEIITRKTVLELLNDLKNANPEKFSEGERRINAAEEEASKFATIIEGADQIPLILKKRNIYSAILTNNSRNTVDLYIKKFSFLKGISILTREDLKKPKPDPEGILSIINIFKNKRITKESTVCIGDSYLDALAAYRANVKFILYNSRNIDLNRIPTPPYAILTRWDDFESQILGKKEKV